MEGRILTVHEAIFSLGKKNIIVDDKSITINENTIVGNKSWGLIDFLRNHGGYRKVYRMKKINGKISTELV